MTIGHHSRADTNAAAHHTGHAPQDRNGARGSYPGRGSLPGQRPGVSWSRTEPVLPHHRTVAQVPDGGPLDPLRGLRLGLPCANAVCAYRGCAALASRQEAAPLGSSAPMATPLSLLLGFGLLLLIPVGCLWLIDLFRLFGWLADHKRRHRPEAPLNGRAVRRRRGLSIRPGPGCIDGSDRGLYRHRTPAFLVYTPPAGRAALPFPHASG